VSPCTEPPGRAVSNEDREVLDDLARAICDAGPNTGLWDTDRLGDVTRREIVTAAGAALAVVVSHGWGPRPTVSAEAIEDAAGCCGHQPVINLLRECGIEVTDGD
jgi:hypothetical protein